MKEKLQGSDLIDELLEKPEKFDQDGKAYNLLQAYFDGFEISTLAELLKSSDPSVQRSAIWILSELGTKGASLTKEIIPLLQVRDTYILYHALECVAVSSGEIHDQLFSYILRNLQSNDSVIRTLCMRLIGNTPVGQLRNIPAYLQSISNKEDHVTGLGLLINLTLNDSSLVKNILLGDNELLKKYGCIAAKKLYSENPDLINIAISSNDPDLVKFGQEVIDLESD